jgi:transcription-repair coupling factor (superfamily II helicase)
MKRLRLLGSLDSLGAGFNLASHDLDLRGAGNLLGDEQSGHIKEVGYELYQQMLEETIARIKSGELQGLSTISDDWSPQLNLGVPVMIPETYIPDLDLRLGLYRRLSSLTTKVELEGVCGRADRPLRSLAQGSEHPDADRPHQGDVQAGGISKLDAGPKGATIQFHNDKFANPAGLVDFLRRRAGRRGSTATGSCWWAR